MPIRNVTEKDCGSLEGVDIHPLHTAFKKVCFGIEGDALWEKILDSHKLRIQNDCAAWVIRMNAAIGIWNINNPQSCEEVKTAYGV